MIELITFKNIAYPAFQAEGNAAQFIMPFAQRVCKGEGFDIGSGKPEWAFPGSTVIDPECYHHNDENHKFTANNLPVKIVDYIFSSHCLEHIPDWVGTLDYWYNHLKEGGVLFLYLPDYSQEYWRPWNNRKHIHVIDKDVIHDYFKQKYNKVFCSGVDLNNSFAIMGEK